MNELFFLIGCAILALKDCKGLTLCQSGEISVTGKSCGLVNSGFASIAGNVIKCTLSTRVGAAYCNELADRENKMCKAGQYLDHNGACEVVPAGYFIPKDSTSGVYYRCPLRFKSDPGATECYHGKEFVRAQGDFMDSAPPSTTSISTKSRHPTVSPTIGPTFPPDSIPPLGIATTDTPTYLTTRFTNSSGVSGETNANSAALLGALLGGLCFMIFISSYCYARYCRKKGHVVNEIAFTNQGPSSKSGNGSYVTSYDSIDQIYSGGLERRQSDNAIELLLHNSRNQLRIVRGSSIIGLYQPMGIAWNELKLSSKFEPLLGKGSFGVVIHALWQQKNSKIEKEVAVKVFTKSLAESSGIDFDEVCRSAYDEARIGKRAESTSDHVIKLYGIAEGVLPDEFADFFHIVRGTQSVGMVMRYEAGGSLGHLLHGNKHTAVRSLSLLEKLSLLEGISQGLTELHDACIIHGDIKPDNILLDSPANPKIRFADFGLSKIREELSGSIGGPSTLQQTYHIKGTPHYCAPEMLFNPYSPIAIAKLVAKASRKTDMYAFAILAWEILAQQRPFSEVRTEPELGVTVHQGIRPPLESIPSVTPPDIINMITSNWSVTRSERKTASECYSILFHHHQVLTVSEFDIFFSHAWINKPFLSHVFAELARLKYRVWYDQNDMGHDMQASMMGGISRSKVVLACINETYQSRDNCMFELRYAHKVKKAIVTVAINKNPGLWASEEVMGLCELDKKLYVDIGDIAQLPWESDDGATEDMLTKLKQALTPLLRVLKDVGCEPSFDP